MSDCNIVLQDMHSGEIIKQNLCNKNDGIQSAWDHLRTPGVHPATCFKLVDKDKNSIWFGDSWGIMQHFEECSDKQKSQVEILNTIRMFRPLSNINNNRN